jgi:hypothetical protein
MVLTDLEERRIGFDLEYRTSSVEDFDYLSFTSPLVAFSGPSVLLSFRPEIDD